MAHSRKLPIVGFVCITLVTQLLAAATCVIVWSVVPSLTLAMLACTTTALIAATLTGLPVAWRVLNVSMPIATAATLAIEVSNAVYIVPLTLLAAIYAPALLTRVPYYPTSKEAYALLLAELPVDRPFRFVDIGCGFGDLLTFLAKHRPHGHFIGIELGLLPYLTARLRASRSANGNIEVVCRDMWSFPISDCDFVYTFLSPAAMPRIWEKVSHEMSPESTFITNSFPVPVDPTETISVRDARSSTLYVHRFPAQQKPLACP